MSGICGIVRLDGAPADAADLEVLTDALTQRGPDRTGSWREGHVAIGHTLLATTPEAAVEAMPFIHAESGCVITADVRLDNREELFASLSLGTPRLEVGDGELILRAYLKWGKECPTRLLGDFAFAIWDGRRGELFCARDHMGMKQLIYTHVEGRLFAFATEPDALVKLKEVPKRINETRIADFLEGALEGADLTSTFFEDVFRLPPAHSLVLGNAGLRISKYWALEPGDELRLSSDEAYAEAFLEVFTEAVRVRLRSHGGVGSMLSGGMDSSSVSAVAARLMREAGQGPLPTFSAVGPDPEVCPETKAIHAALGIAHINPHLINYAELGDLLPELVEQLRTIKEPFDGSMSLPRAVYLTARRAGVRIVLDGAGGDIILSAGDPIRRLIRSGAWFEAWREAKGEEAVLGPGFRGWRNFAKAIYRAMEPDTLTLFRRSRPLLRLVRPSGARGDLIAPVLARKVNVAARWQSLEGITLGLPDRDARARTMTHPYLTVARERYDRISSMSAIEARDPFLDIRLLRFCLSLPDNQLTWRGWSKTILRRAMHGALPPTIRQRTGKEHLGSRFSEALLGSLVLEARWAAVGLERYVTPNQLDSCALPPTHDGIARQHDIGYIAVCLSAFLADSSDH